MEIFEDIERRVPLSVSATNHPKHYNVDGRMECIQEMEIMFGDEAVETFCKLNAYKYFYRAGSKEGEAKEKDLAKAKWYLDYVAGLRR